MFGLFNGNGGSAEGGNVISKILDKLVGDSPLSGFFSQIFSFFGLNKSEGKGLLSSLFSGQAQEQAPVPTQDTPQQPQSVRGAPSPESSQPAFGEAAPAQAPASTETPPNPAPQETPASTVTPGTTSTP